MELHILKSPKYKEILLSSDTNNRPSSILFKNSSPRTTSNHRGVHDGFIEYGYRNKLTIRQKKSTKNVKMILHSNDTREIYIVKSQSDKDTYFPIIYIHTIHGKRRLDFSMYDPRSPSSGLHGPISNVTLDDWANKKIDTDSNRYIKLKKIRFDVIDNKIKRVHVYK